MANRKIEVRESRRNGKSLEAINKLYKMLVKYPDNKIGMFSKNIEQFAEQFKSVTGEELHYEETDGWYLLKLKS